MVELFKNLNKKEKFIFQLRKLFEDYGYKNLSVNLLEDYESYSYGDMIKDENILKLIHPNGKLYALRPDMTIPIAKRFAREAKNSSLSHKVYYSDSIFRIEQKSYEGLNEIKQMGVEALGVNDRISDLEILTLVKEVLATINEKFHIDLAHSGMLKKLFEMGKFSREEKETISDYIGKRGSSDLNSYLKNIDVSDELKKCIELMPTLNGEFGAVIEKLKNTEILKDFVGIISELEELQELLNIYNIKADLDFSITSNLRYYSGIIFKGYIPNISESVLNGGRYDTLAKNFGNDIPAIGFAVNLTEVLNGFEDTDKPNGVLVFYDENNKNELIQTVKNLRDKVGIVRLEKNIELTETEFERLKFEYETIYLFQNGKLEEKKWK